MKSRRRGRRPTVCPECDRPHDQRSEAEAAGEGPPVLADVPPEVVVALFGRIGLSRV